MLEKILFNLVAFSLFIIIFSKIIKKNDTNYIGVLLLQAIGISISFFEIRLGIEGNAYFKFLRYILSIILPLSIVLLELKKINFSEILSIFISKFLIMVGDTKAAKNVLVKLVTKYPESHYGHKILAEVYEKEGGMRRAIDEYVSAVDIRKNDYKSYFKIAHLLKDLDKKDEAIEMLDRLVKSKPDCYEASCLLGELLCEQERFKEAANIYQDALKYKPADFELYYNLGIVYTRLSDFQMAKEMYEKAAAINHKLYGAHYSLGQIAFIQRDLETAENYFKNSLDEEFEAISYYQLAKIYAIKGEKDKAINFLNKAIELDYELLKLAEKEKIFKELKEYITLSVKMDKEENEEEPEINEEQSILKEQEKIAQKYLEETAKLIDEMSENESKQKIAEKVNLIFNREKLKKLKELANAETEKVEKKENEKEYEKEEKHKQLGSN